MSTTATSETVERAAPPSRIWHICTSPHPVGECRPGCVSYCGLAYRPGGRAPRTERGVQRIDICVICQGLREARP